MSTTVPPKRFLRFFRWFCHPDLKLTIEGDLMELYDERVRTFGKRSADKKFMLDVVLLFRPGVIMPLEGVQHLNDYDMFKNYFKVGIRNILKYKVFSFINVFGLALAMSVCMLIILMLSDQYRYDAFHKKNDSVYRILSNYKNSRQPYATSPFPLASALKAEYPIIEETTNLTPDVGGDATYNQRIVEMRGYFADPAFFRVFSFELTKGDKQTALKAPHSMVISSHLAHQLFDDADPIGKTIDFSDRGLPFPQRYDGVGTPPVSWGSFNITGVIDESLYKSHLKFDVLVSSTTMQTLSAEKKMTDRSNDWEWFYRTYTYVVLDTDKDATDLALALNNLARHKYANIKSDEIKEFAFVPQKLSDVQLNLVANDTNNRLPRIGYYFLGTLAIIIMILACLNYTNLSVARALTRAKEIGVRKVTGANRKSLIFQFLSESMITALLALTMAIVLLLFIKPAFRGLWVNQYLDFELPSTASVYLLFTGFALLIGFIAGVYPALHLSTYQPVKALKNLNTVTPGKMGLRKVLGVSQFVVSLFFITTSILIYNQFKYFLEFNYGFTPDHIVNIQLQGSDYKKIANELSTVPGVSAISACDIIPSTGRNNGIEIKKIGTADEFMNADILLTDENFISNLGIKLVAGRSLPPAGESTDRFILLNEAAVKKLGYKHPNEIIGQAIESKWNKEPLVVVGVATDFRLHLLINRNEIGPLIMRNQPSQFTYVNVKIISTDLMGTVAKLEEKWKRVDSVHPFKYEFYDEQLAFTHQGIFDLVSILGFIAFLAITIACLGLLGMATYTAERKTKEVGIRKVLGAEELSIALLLSREFLKMLAISICIGAPLTYVVNNFWLEKFPNRVDFGAGTLLMGIAVLITLGLVTIGSQTIMASKRNPADSLKME